jgi:hypothetical protein
MAIPVPVEGALAALAHEVQAHEIQVHDAAASAAEALEMESRRSSAATAVATPLAPGLTPTPGKSSAIRSASRSGLRAGTTIERMLIKTSPYGTLRTLAAVSLGVGAILAALAFLGGLVTMLVLAINGSPGLGIAIFGGGLVASILLGIGAKILYEVLRLLADVGDRSRQSTLMLDDLLNRPRDESF